MVRIKLRGKRAGRGTRTVCEDELAWEVGALPSGSAPHALARGRVEQVRGGGDERVFRAGTREVMHTQGPPPMFPLSMPQNRAAGRLQI